MTVTKYTFTLCLIKIFLSACIFINEVSPVIAGKNEAIVENIKDHGKEKHNATLPAQTQNYSWPLIPIPTYPQRIFFISTPKGLSFAPREPSPIFGRPACDLFNGGDKNGSSSQISYGSQFSNSEQPPLLMRGKRMLSPQSTPEKSEENYEHRPIKRFRSEENIPKKIIIEDDDSNADQDVTDSDEENIEEIRSVDRLHQFQENISNKFTREPLHADQWLLLQSGYADLLQLDDPATPEKTKKHILNKKSIIELYLIQVAKNLPFWQLTSEQKNFFHIALTDFILRTSPKDTLGAQARLYVCHLFFRNEKLESIEWYYAALLEAINGGLSEPLNHTFHQN